MPLTAISTGFGDLPECTLLKMGFDPSEFTTNSGTGHFQLYSTSSDFDAGTHGAGAVAGDSSQGESSLFASASSLSPYDQILLPCWGSLPTKTSAELQNLASYLSLGGRVWASHDSMAWLYTNSNGGLMNAAVWDVAGATTLETGALGTIDTTTSRGSTFATWAFDTLLIAMPTPPTMNISANYHIVDSASSPALGLIAGASPTGDGGTTPETDLLTFGTPFGSASTCGQVSFASFHTFTGAGADPSMTFPAECVGVLDGGPLAAMTSDERLFEYAFYDLAGPTCTPTVATTGSCVPVTSCGGKCGPVADGCGGLITTGGAPTCGTCVAPATCGGAGVPSQCGVPGG
jgi:hypothetical protein